MPPPPDPLPRARERGQLLAGRSVPDRASRAINHHAGFHRFFVDPALLGGDRVALSGPQAHQIRRVLRLKVGDRVVLVDGAGQEYRVRLDEVRSSAVSGTVELIRPSRPEPSLILTLYQALVQRDRFEAALQKGTEVGISRFVPTWCERSNVSGERIDEKRLERWRRIVTEAAEQCERGIVPEVTPPVRFDDAIAAGVAAGPLLMAWEREDARSIRSALVAALKTGDGGRSSLGLFVGPEGGFTATEVAVARDAGALTVSLGPRILRTETAGPILAALALYDAGDLTPAPLAPNSLSGARERGQGGER
jgi:16S rRNA (uracil1498-N3)-methyltransferase